MIPKWLLMTVFVVAASLPTVLVSAPQQGVVSGAKVRVTRAEFGTLPDGTPIDIFTLANAHGMQVRAMTYGGIITSITVPDRHGKSADVVLGHDTLSGYFDNNPHFGGVIGRYANRIANAKFVLDGHVYQLEPNDKSNTLHGGRKGFDQAVWTGKSFERAGTAGVAFTLTSPDGEAGFPGKLDVTVTYTLNDNNELAIDYRATTNLPTVVNLTQHSYFNLAGEGVGDVLGHEVVIKADHYTPVNANLIPTGELAAVANTPFDFRKLRRVGELIAADDPQLKVAGGYDHNYVLHHRGGDLVLAAHVEEPTTGRVLEVRTTEPGVQFYTGNSLGSITGKGGHTYGKRAGLCLETQHWPDSPNHPNFPSTTLRPGQIYRSTTIYSFSSK